MPFKGDMRLGGPHDNEGTLNGTSSEFDSVPLVGTVLSGPTDTSRYENDYNGTPFYMPYSTTVYADGLGGQYSIETWGLQYYPAGWVTGTTNIDLYASWNYTTQDNTWNTNGTVQYGIENNNNVEDGTGINYLSSTGISYSVSAGQTVASSHQGSPADRYRVVMNAYANGTDFQDYTIYPWYGTNLGGATFGNNYITTPCSTISAGSWGIPDEFADGYGGSYNDGSAYSNYDTYPSGSFLQECNGQYLYASGGGYTTGFAPLGTAVSTSFSNSLHWQSPNFAVDGVEGDFTYSAGGCSGTADGNGGMNNQSCGGWNANTNDAIANGTYYYSQGDGTFEEDGTTEKMQNHTFIWSYTYAGMGVYNSNISDTYVIN